MEARSKLRGSVLMLFPQFLMSIPTQDTIHRQRGVGGRRMGEDLHRKFFVLSWQFF
jgi:hypothetical protein